MSRRILTLLLTALPLLGLAQDKKGTPGFFKRLELGYTIVTDKADYQLTYPVERTRPLQIDKVIYDTVISRTIKSKGGFGLTLGTNAPLAQLGEASVLALSVNFMYNMLVWEKESAAPGSTPVRSLVATPNEVEAANANQGGSTTQIGLPIGLDVKFGCDAITDKGYRFCTSFGTGAIPMAAMTTFNGDDETVMRIRPYVKAELGIYAGVCFKVRALYAFGRYQYLNVDKTVPGSSLSAFDNNVQLNGGSSFNISLIMMPFAGTWSDDKWYR